MLSWHVGGAAAVALPLLPCTVQSVGFVVGR